MQYLFSLIFFFLFLSGCKNNSSPTDSLQAGVIVGKLTLYADNGLSLKDNSGAQVLIEGTSFSTLTPLDGSWQLRGVPPGSYTIVFSKTGFVTEKNYGFQLNGSDTAYSIHINLAQTPKATVTQLQITGPDTNGYFTVQGDLSSADSLSRRVVILFDKTPIPDSSTVKYIFFTGYDVQPDSMSFSFVDRALNYNLSYNGITIGPQGLKLYARACALPRYGFFACYNPSTKKYEIYSPGIAFSNLDSLFLP